MEQKRTDLAHEPVDTQDDNEFMDTGVLHEPVKDDEDDKEDE